MTRRLTVAVDFKSLVVSKKVKKASDWGTRGDDGSLDCQAACLSQRWEKAERTLPSLGKGDVAHEQRKV